MSESIRPLTSDDVAAVIAMEASSYPQPWSEDHYQKELEKPYSHAWVLTDDETDSEARGVMVFWHVGDEVELLNFTVDPAYRRGGKATLFLQKLIRYCLTNKVKKISLDVRKSNEAAIRLYDNHGFFISHVRKAYYSNGEDAYHMELLLDGSPNRF